MYLTFANPLNHKDESQSIPINYAQQRLSEEQNLIAKAVEQPRLRTDCFLLRNDGYVLELND